MLQDTIHNAYQLFLKQGGQRAALLESIFQIDATKQSSLDDSRNEASVFSALTSEENLRQLSSLHSSLMDRLASKTLDQSNEEIDALACLQEILSVALWKHNRYIGFSLESFVREFDRLDMASERARLHDLAQFRRWGDSKP